MARLRRQAVAGSAERQHSHLARDMSWWLNPGHNAWVTANGDSSTILPTCSPPAGACFSRRRNIRTGDCAARDMDAPQLPPLSCPKCRASVVPQKATIGWYCPHCGWRFLERDIVEAQREAERDEKPRNENSGGKAG